MSSDLTRLLACPDCHGDLTGVDDLDRRTEIICRDCGATYGVRDGIPILLPAACDAELVHDELDHDHGHKARQAGYYDRAVAEEFEIARPHSAPDAYRWLLDRKFARGVARLPSLAGAAAADVCCGSGMDAEMLARRGARVIAIDISEGCVRRAKARAERYGVEYLAVVGDVEHLPLRDRGVDVSYVHDGLHHLSDPASGLREMMRVASGAVSINEPAAAAATALAVRLRLALEREDAGNRVARLSAADVASVCESEGFDARAERYLMYYRHDPGALMRLASRSAARMPYRAVVAAADAVGGRWGNKLQVTALRRAA